MENLYNLYIQNQLICTDSRKIEKDCIFFALRGEHFNGNLFASKAIEKGAKAVVIDEPDRYINDGKHFLVENVLQTLQDLAKFHREHLNIDVIVVAGSNGKTTVKELTYRVLSKRYNVFSTPGNLNNHIGVPMSILNIKKQHEIAVIEIGANHKGENMDLCEIAKPTYAIVTNCGKDHLEGFGSVKGVIESNSEVYDYLYKVKGKCFVNADDTILVDASLKNDKILFGNSSANNSGDLFVSGEILNSFPFISVNISENTDFKFPSFAINSNLFGSFQLYNILTATTIGLYFGINHNLISDAIENYRPVNNRSQLIDWNDNKVLLDAYNANPSSMIPMINDFSEFNVPSKIVVLGDMFELGTESEKEHKNIAELLATKEFEKIILVGKEFNKYKHLVDCLHFNDYNDLKVWLSQCNLKHVFFLVKGSRGMYLERAFE